MQLLLIRKEHPATQVERVERLPDDEQEVVNLLFYESLTQEDAARVLGVSLRTVYRDLEALQAVDFPLYTDKTGREAA